MVSIFQQILAQWNSDKNQRTKLQRAYFMLVILLTLTAGALAAVNAELSRSVVTAAAFLLAVYTVNGVAWLLLDSLVSPKLPELKTKPERTSRKK